MIILRKMNYRNVRLGTLYNKERIGVRRRNGEITYLPFLGFAERVDAIDAGAMPVLLEACGYYASHAFNEPLVSLKPGEWIQGAAIKLGVYAVTDGGILKIVQKAK